MKRDMDLTRKILLAMEQRSENDQDKPFEFEGHPDEEVCYHIKLLAEADFLDARDDSTHDGEAWTPLSLTWSGHEFLDAARDNTLWNKAKQQIVEKGGGFTVQQ